MTLKKTETAPALKVMTCEEYFEGSFAESFDAYVQESYWEQSFSTDTAFEIMVMEAADDGVTLSDVLTWDYDKVLYDAYRNTEKGLS